MSVSPINFNGMVQNTNEVSIIKTQEDNKANLIQENVQVILTREGQEHSHQVNEQANIEENTSNDGEGNGRGYEGNRDRNKNNKQKKEEKLTDGVVIKKNERPSFDVSI